MGLEKQRAIARLHGCASESAVGFAYAAGKIRALFTHLFPPMDRARPAPSKARPDHIRAGSRHGEPGFAPSKILIHGVNFAPEMIGCAKYTTELAEFLARRGHSVEVVTAPPHYPGWFVRRPYVAWRYSREVIDAIKVVRCPLLTKRNSGGIWRLIPPLSFALSAAPMVAWRIIRSRPNVVMCIEPTLFSSPVAVLAAKIVGSRTVLHVQDLEIDAAFEIGHVKGEPLRRIALFFERIVLKRFDRIVTISGKMQSALAAKGVPDAKIEILRNWVNLEKIRPQPKHVRNSYRIELGVKDDIYVVLYAGHIGAKQALDVVLSAARRLATYRDILFVIAGEGPLKAQLIEANRDLRNVIHLPLQPAERLNDLLNMADLHVLPQLKGAADLVLPSKLSGMLASGRPIVVTADSGSELHHVLDNVARLVPSGDDHALAQAILTVKSSDPSAQVKRGEVLAGTMSSKEILPMFEEALLVA